MASGLSSVVVLALCVTLAPCVSAGSKDCDSYTDASNIYHSSKTCYIGFCCGTCFNRYCCQDSFWRFPEEKQDECEIHYTMNTPLASFLGIAGTVAVLLLICCFCPCCCLYKMCRKPRPVIATTTHTTVVTAAPQQYPQQPTATSGQPHSYQGLNPPYQPIPVQPGYGAQPMPQGYGVQPMPTSPYSGQPFTAGPPPTYQEATGPSYPPNPMPYSQAAFAPGQPAYPLQPPVQPQPNVPFANTDYLSQPAYNPNYVAPPP